MANRIVAQMLFLEAEDPEKNIYLYINSPGGVITAGLGIYDTMNHIRPDVCTICYGVAASMGAFLLGAGAKGKRSSLLSSRIMIHQPSGGAQGQAVDIEIQAKEILYLKQQLNQVHVENCSFSPHPQPLSQRARGAGKAFKVPLLRATVYTHLGRGINVLRDPPKSPLKRGTLNPAPPFLRGVGGDQIPLRLDQKTCVYTVASGRGI